MDTWNVDLDQPEKVVGHIEKLAAESTGPFIVCFDYFDTIATRRVAPEHTKKIASAILSQLLDCGMCGEDLYEHRRQLELAMTTKNGEENGELDFSLADLAPLYHETLSALQPVRLRIGRQEFVSLLLHIEVAVERAVQEVCPQALHLLERLKSKGFALVLVSDFYLPEEYFRMMLQALDVERFFDAVYISSSLGTSKGSGKVYGRIAEELKSSPDRMLMIGDNLHADIRMAGNFGMRTLHVQRPARQDFYAAFSRSRAEGKATGMAEHLTECSPHGLFGEMACSLWLFTHRLFQSLWKSRESEVFFLSKEGEFLKKLFVRYQRVLFGKEVIRSHYLLASRKATFLASLRELEQEDFLRLFAHYRDISLSDFLNSLNFEEECIAEIGRQFPDVFTSRMFDLRSRPEFSRLLALPSFRQSYEDRRRQQRKNFAVYLDSFGVDLRNKGLALVDVGWKGSIQDNIWHILDGKVTIQGYYIGIFHATERREGNRKTGLLFDNTDGTTPHYAVYNNNRSLYEMLLGASHGSADRYLVDDCLRSAPDTGRCHEHVGIETGEGRLRVMVLDLPEERTLFNETILPLQEKMLRSFEQMCTSYLLGDCLLPPAEWFARRHARMVFLPRKEEVDFFASLYHLENFGIFEYTSFHSDARLTAGERLRNLYRLLSDSSLLESGIWPPIILRRLGLGFLQKIDGIRRYSREFRGCRCACPRPAGQH